MTAPIKLLYGSPTPITMSLDSLAGASGWQSDAVDNTSDLFIDVIFQLVIAFPNTTPDGSIAWGIIPSLDGVTFAANATGTDGTYDWVTNVQTGNGLLSYSSGPPIQNASQQWTFSTVYSIGYVPPKFSFGVYNGNSTPLGTGCSLTYLGVKAQVG